jgi:hypothetical protein
LGVAHWAKLCDIRLNKKGVPGFVKTAVELDAWHAIVKQNGKTIQRRLPIPNRHDPFLAHVVHSGFRFPVFLGSPLKKLNVQWQKDISGTR